MRRISLFANKLYLKTLYAIADYGKGRAEVQALMGVEARHEYGIGSLEEKFILERVMLRPDDEIRKWMRSHLTPGMTFMGEVWTEEDHAKNLRR
jgi:hypothetical protein